MSGPKTRADAGLGALERRVEEWFASRSWRPFEFQRDTWRAYLSGQSGLLHAPTGAGKTASVWLGPALERMLEPDAAVGGLRVLWLTPLRALASDTASSLREIAAGVGAPWTVELRTGDTPQSVRKRQRERPPDALVTTPESLSLLLSYPDPAAWFAGLRCVIVDEWHELLGTKRGVQTELCLARLRRLAPSVRTWGLSATLGNLRDALSTLLGQDEGGDPAPGRLVAGRMDKRIELRTLLPESLERFPWAGHLGARMVGQVVRAIESARSTLLFTNTRSQTELWFQSLLRERPEWLGEVALHHGSVDRAVREEVESMLAAGRTRCVVCTSSLDLGVDFTPVDQVIQVGSPKGVARIIQRAGRSGHQPGAASRALGVPTHALELVEFAAAREAIAARRLESRAPLERPIDVLAQHLVTLACGEPLDADAALREVRTTRAFRDLTEREWGWTLDFVTRGGDALRAYPQYQRLREREGRLAPADEQVARRHRLMVGTITGEPTVVVRLRSGASLGTVEEGFVGRLREGDTFLFAGRLLELLQVRDLTAYVAPARRRGAAPQWMGAKMPLSTMLAEGVRDRLEAARMGVFDGPEMQLVRPVLELQRACSRIPARDEVLVERVPTRDGVCLFVFPFEGRLAHEGLSALVAHRLAKRTPLTIAIASNDYGFSLVCSADPGLDERAWRSLLAGDRLVEDLLECVNATQLARQRFRAVARVAGLLAPVLPGSRRPGRRLQASAELFYDVLHEFDPSNLLLEQARREVLERELEVTRLADAFDRIARSSLALVDPPDLTPLAFPVWAEFVQANVTSEPWSARVKRMAARLEARAQGQPPPVDEPPEPAIIEPPPARRARPGARRLAYRRRGRI